MTLSAKLTALSDTLATLTGHSWAVYEDFTPLQPGQRQGRIFVPFLSIPEVFNPPIGRYELRQMVTVGIHTRLKFASTSDRIAEAVDYPAALPDLIFRAAETADAEIVATNGDRHAALEVSLRPQIDTDAKLIGDCNTAAVWAIYWDEPSSRP